MKQPRAFLNPAQEVACRLAKIAGTKAGMLMLSEGVAPNLALAKQLRELKDLPPGFKEELLELASRIERRMYAQGRPGVTGIDREGYFQDSKGNRFLTPESAAAAKEFYQ